MSIQNKYHVSHNLLLKAAVSCLFVTISVWKSVIAAVRVIIFLACKCMFYGSASQSPDSGLHPDPGIIQSVPASISYFKSTDYISYFDKRMLNL